jgi:hypothetical protein
MWLRMGSNGGLVCHSDEHVCFVKFFECPEYASSWVPRDVQARAVSMSTVFSFYRFVEFS